MSVIESHRISKREFLRQCVFCTGGFALGAYRPNWFSFPSNNDLGKMCEWLCINGLSDAPLHFSRFTPLYKLSQLPSTPTVTLEKAHEIAKEAGIKYVYLGNVGGHWAENTYCPKCKKIIVERQVFTILANHIVKGKCKFCGEKIPGIWS